MGLSFNEFRDHDQSFIARRGHDAFVNGIASADEPRDGHVVAVRSRAFAEKLQSSLQELSGTRVFLVTTPKLAEYCESLFAPKLLEGLGTVDGPDLFLSRLSEYFYREKASGRSSGLDGREDGSALIHETAKIAPNVFIGRHCKVGAHAILHPGVVLYPDCEVGDQSELFAHVVVYPDSKIGKRCRLHAQVVIGSDGFGYNFDGEKHLKVWHLAGAFIGDDVEIGASSSVDAGAFRPTRVGDGSRFDNLVQIGHNSQIGKGVIFCGQSACAGSVHVGDFSVIGGKVGLGPGVSLGAGCQVGGNAMVTKSWPAGSKIGGHPARALNQWLKENAALKHLAQAKKGTS